MHNSHFAETTARTPFHVERMFQHVVAKSVDRPLRARRMMSSATAGSRTLRGVEAMTDSSGTAATDGGVTATEEPTTDPVDEVTMLVGCVPFLSLFILLLCFAFC